MDDLLLVQVVCTKTFLVFRRPLILGFASFVIVIVNDNDDGDDYDDHVHVICLQLSDLI